MPKIMKLHVLELHDSEDEKTVQIRDLNLYVPKTAYHAWTPAQAAQFLNRCG